MKILFTQKPSQSSPSLKVSQNTIYILYPSISHLPTALLLLKNYLLSPTDYLVIEYAEKRSSIPRAIRTARNAVRSHYKDMLKKVGRLPDTGTSLPEDLLNALQEWPSIPTEMELADDG